ncbi:hypothetical protein RclHR1_27620002 [Rhizophagus clarus]|uniref:DNA-directed DNA polymerase n=1 Tax=Rhizophagus clarus TaxID=94130 RepID=A0A2Z6R296_9GLOM|nr:hypothetical protein RclHR1_27620002 [Rhizophagus clarus]
MEFKNYGQIINAPCIIIADFKADNKKCDELYGGSMHKLAEQKANSFSYMVYWIDTGDVWGLSYTEMKMLPKNLFVKSIQELVRINEILAVKHERKVTEKDKKNFADQGWELRRTQIFSYIASKTIKEIENLETMVDKVWDHCHITGKYRGSAHNFCNLKLRIEAWKTPIPIIFYNFREYDLHLVCESVGRSVNAHQIRQFMNTSLAKFAENLGNNKPITKKHFKDLGYTDEQIDLVTRKGVQPYDYIDSQDRFKETELPPFHEFHSILGGKITQKDYEHAQKIWKEFNCKNLGEYNDLYLKIDVLLLADVWTEFRKMSMESDGLDPSHYTSLPALSWDSMLKMTEVKIELFTDMAMHDFIEKSKHRGLTMAVHRYFQANNPKMGEKWLDITLRTKADSCRGLCLGGNAHFPYKTHDYLSDLPPAVENVAVEKDWLSPYNAKLVEKIDGDCFAKTEKLIIPHLGKRNYYVIHYQELQYYVKLRMIIDEVTEILSFEQSNWLAPYISLNTENHNEAKKAGNTFLSDFFILKNNACYGKTIENVRKYQDVKLMRNINEQDEKALLNKICSLRFKYA